MFVESWKLITSDVLLISWIKGYKIPFTRKVTQHTVPSEPSWLLSEFNFISKALDHLLEIGAVESCLPCQGQFISKIFIVPKQDGSRRLILNLK